MYRHSGQCFSDARDAEAFARLVLHEPEEPEEGAEVTEFAEAAKATEAAKAMDAAEAAEAAKGIEVVEAVEAVAAEVTAEAAVEAEAAPRPRTFSLAPDPLPPRQLPAGLGGSAGSSAGGDGGSGDGSGGAADAVAAAAAEAAAEAGAAARRRVCAGILRRSAKRAGCAGWSLRDWDDNERPSGAEARSPCGACGGARGGSRDAELPSLFAPEGEAEPLAVLYLFASLHTLVHSRTHPYHPR